MNLENRIRRLEEFSAQQFAGDGNAGQWAELSRLFGSHNLRQRLAAGEPGIGKSVGQFLRQNRYQCPEAEILLVRAVPGRPDQSRVVVSGDVDGAKFLQLVQCEDNPEQPEVT
jgi:hypothetical protein